jgi:hypothetical protein
MEGLAMAAPRGFALRPYFCRALIGLSGFAILTGISALNAPGGQVTPAEPLVSLDAQNRPLADVLAEVARQTGMTITLNNPWRGHPVNASIQQMPLTKALKRILASLNHTVVYESGREIRIEVYGEAVSRPAPLRPAPSYATPASPPEIEPSAEPTAEEKIEEPDERQDAPDTDGGKGDETSEGEPGSSDQNGKQPKGGDSTSDGASSEKTESQN